MNVHYFQRYSSKENVATANTLLLLSRFYSYSSRKFFSFLSNNYFDEAFNGDVEFAMQKRVAKSVPDGVICQDSFKIIIETKLTDWFYEDQLINHLQAFEGENFKLLLTLSSEYMAEDKKDDIDKSIKEYNEKCMEKGQSPILHVNTTFYDLFQAITEELDETDYEFKDILDDYMEYLYDDSLVSGVDIWKTLCVKPVGTTFDSNKSRSVYYQPANRGFRPHEFIGLYTKKCIRAIGQVTDIITFGGDEAGPNFKAEKGEVNDRTKGIIEGAIKDSIDYGYNLASYEHRYFIVDKFYDTSFKKISSGGLLGTRYFDLESILDINEPVDASEIAEMLRDKEWV